MKNVVEKILQDENELFDYSEMKEEKIDKIKRIFKSYGFRQIKTTTVEDFGIFSEIDSPVLSKDVFKIVDSHGDILALRPDMTIPISNKIGRDYKLKGESLKIFYVSQIFRMNEDKKLQESEFTQAGIEYFGQYDYQCDAEVIAVAANILEKNTKRFRIEMGNTEFYKGLMEEVDIKVEVENIIKNCIERKNLTELEMNLNKLGLDDEIREVFLNLPKLYGNFTDVIERARLLSLNKRMDNALEDLVKVYEILLDYGYEEYISVDLGLITCLDYYTGIIFTGYIENYGKIVLSGGRYDNLTSKYGNINAAMGFGINIDEMIKGLNVMFDKNKKAFSIDYLTLYTEKDRREAFKLSKSLRDKGFIVESQNLKKDLKEYIENAEKKSVDIILFLSGNKLKMIDINKNTFENFDMDSFNRKIQEERINFLFSPIH